MDLSSSQVKCLGFFVMKDFKIKFEVQIIQNMKYVICYQDGKAQSCESSQNKNGFITYNPKHGINNMMKQMENKHGFDLANTNWKL
jgi:hypothetical protein